MASKFATIVERLDRVIVRNYGVEIYYQPKGGAAKKIDAVFGNALELDADPGGVWPSLFVPLGELDSPPQKGDSVRVEDAQGQFTEYTVFEAKSPTDGGTTLALQKGG